jgi:hypothetical protein
LPPLISKVRQRGVVSRSFNTQDSTVGEDACMNDFDFAGGSLLHAVAEHAAGLLAATTGLHAWWQSMLMNDEDRFIGAADDLAHVERRLRAVERGRWRAADDWGSHG